MKAQLLVFLVKICPSLIETRTGRKLQTDGGQVDRRAPGSSPEWQPSSSSSPTRLPLTYTSTAMDSDERQTRDDASKAVGVPTVPAIDVVPLPRKVDDSHRRMSSQDIDPYVPSDLYYSPNTDPSNKYSKYNRLRTLSMAAPKAAHSMRSYFSPSPVNSDDSASKSTNTPKKSISPIGKISNNSKSPPIHSGQNMTEANSDTFFDRFLQNCKISSGITTPVISSDSDDEYDDSDSGSTIDDDKIEQKEIKKFKQKNKYFMSGLTENPDLERSHSTGSLVIESEFVSTNDLVKQSGELENHHPASKENQEIPFPKSSPLDSKDSKFQKDLRSLSPSPSTPTIRRRASADLSSSRANSKRFFISDIDATLEELLRNEDTDHNCQITIEDTGPKVLKLGTANSGGFKQYDIRGTYMLSNLLQELTIAKRFGRQQMILDEARLNENPVSRLYRLITTSFWKNLTRQVNEDTIMDMAKDTKIDSEGAKYPRIYVPYNEDEQFYYYKKIAEKQKHFNLQVEKLPKEITASYVKSINDYPGLLALAMRKKSDKYGDLEGFPYIVPGGRFNEQYGWDSYFETLGLLACDKLEPCIGMCENFIFEINNYGKILNANRSYYLCRSQPPFLTDMTLQVFNYIRKTQHREDIDFLKRATMAAIKEYKEVWMSPPRLDPESGLSTYHADGEGIPPETEPSHFDTVLEPFCKKYKLSFKEFRDKYNNGEIKEPILDDYFMHDRAVRESGHDTTYRLEGICANLATVDLNCLLYKYEIDIAFIIKAYFHNHFEYNGEIYTSDDWIKLSEKRGGLIEKFMWNEKESLYFDYNIKSKRQSTYESVTAFYVLWAGVCSPDRARLMVEKSLHKFEAFGGLVSGTERSRGELGVSKPSRQWDYPFAWAPHQILAWEGLKKYNMGNIAQRLSYRWCYLMTLAFVDFNGIVVEKYDATSERQPHKVEAEYGNQGSGFKGVATEGFGWVNASYLLGLQNLDTLSRRALGMVTSPTDFFAKMNPAEKAKYGLV